MSAKAERIPFGPPGKAEAGSVRTRSRGGPFRSRPLGVVRVEAAPRPPGRRDGIARPALASLLCSPSRLWRCVRGPRAGFALPSLAVSLAVVLFSPVGLCDPTDSQ